MCLPFYIQAIQNSGRGRMRKVLVSCKSARLLLAGLPTATDAAMRVRDFVFRTSDGAEVARASDMNALEAQLHTVPEESIAYHSQRNDFSRWLTARTELQWRRSCGREVSDFAVWRFAARSNFFDQRHRGAERVSDRRL